MFLIKIIIIRRKKCEQEIEIEIETELKDIRQTTEINMAPCNVANRL